MSPLLNIAHIHNQKIVSWARVFEGHDAKISLPKITSFPMKWEKHDLAIHKEKDKNKPYEGHWLMIKKKTCHGTLPCTAQKKETKNRKRCPGKERAKIIISTKATNDDCLLNCSAVNDSQQWHQQNQAIMSKHWLKFSAF